jgi:hypothetical protein
MCDTINLRFSQGSYDTTRDLFFYEITNDLRNISRDRHISIRPSHYNPEYYHYYQKNIKRLGKKFQKLNFTFTDNFDYGDIKILPGNIGYVEIRSFESMSMYKSENKGRIEIQKVMDFFKNVNSLIIDLRDNNGGVVDQARDFCSFFSDSSTYFITSETHIRYDSAGKTIDYPIIKKLSTINGKQSFSKAKMLFILTSSRTFSAAELTTYWIQKHSHGVVIGEQTSGGGNTFNRVIQQLDYFAVIPSGKLYDENAGNYSLESKGITPDILTTADSAFAIAYQASLRIKNNQSFKEYRYLRRDSIQFDEREPIYRKTYIDFVGEYQKISVEIRNNHLCMIYDSYEMVTLYPDAPDYFIAKGFGYIKFVRDIHNKISEIQVKYQDGYLERFKKQ